MGLYVMNTFVVEPNNIHYKTTSHNFKLEFTSKTIAWETTNSDFGLNIFYFRLFKNLKNHIGIDDTQLFDVIG
ncbi:hypothetical protein P3L10_005025 [Capsicum annuum]